MMIVASDLMNAVEAIRANADDYRRAADYYHGEVPELFCSTAVRRALRGAHGGFDINLARRPVDAVLDRLAIVAVSVPGDESATRRLVDNIWVPNRMNRYSQTVHWAALTYGDGYLIEWPGDDGAVDMFYNSPVTTRVFYKPENPRIKDYAAKLWAEGKGDQQHHRLNLYYPDGIEKWTTKPGNPGKEESDWFPYHQADGEPWPVLNPFGEIPVFHFRTGEPYGRPEHKGAFGAQNAITKLSSTLMATIDFQGFPQRYALLRAGAGADPDWDSADETLDPDELPASGRLRADPGTLWNLPDAEKVGQFDPANVEAFLNPLRFYARAMAASTATPLRFFEPSGDVPSGESLRADDAPLARRIEDRQDVFAEEWQAALVFAGRVVGEAFPAPDVQWDPVQMVDDEAGWRTAMLKQQAGVPARQVLTEAGYLSDLVEGWLDGSDKPNLDTRIDALTKIGQAMQYLGSAVQLGALDKGQVDTILDQVMGELIRDDGETAA